MQLKLSIILLLALSVSACSVAREEVVVERPQDPVILRPVMLGASVQKRDTVEAALAVIL